MLRRLSSALVVFVTSLTGVMAQVGAGSLQGVVKDKKTGELLPFVSVVIENRGTRVAGQQTDFDGNFRIAPVDPGTYDVTASYVGYQPQKITGVVVNSNKITFQNFELNSGVDLQEVEVVRYKVPLIDKDGGATGQTVTREQIAKMPARSAASVATTVAGASTAGTDGGISIRGGRSDNTYYYIDGVKVTAGVGTALPKSAIEEVQVITGGVPANYGDVTGGLINITTRGPSRSFFGGVEYLTSGYKVGDDITDIVGLDKYAYNQVEASFSGPILFRKDSVGNKVKPLLGFFVSGQFTDVVDGSPLYGGDLRVKQSVKDRLLANPLSSVITNDRQTLLYNTDFLRGSDLERIDTRQNARRRSYVASGKIDIATTPTINLTVGGSMDISRNQEYNRNNSLLNAENNRYINNSTWRGFFRFTQRFNTRETEDGSAKQNGVRNAYYSVQFDYSRFNQKIEDENHKDRFFDYGYLGKYTVHTTPIITELAPGYFRQNGFMDTLVTFQPGSLNPDATALVNSYFSYVRPVNLDGIPGTNGLLNGNLPSSVYNLWSNIGQLGNTYTTFQSDQARVSAMGSADIGKHAVSIGVEYEQLVQRQYGLNPVGLWNRARNLTNFHLRNLDYSDSTFVEGTNGVSVAYFDRLVGDDQTVFDYNLRNSLGLNPRGADFVNVDALDPTQLSLDLFSPDDLINSGNSLVSFYGYDYLGNKLKSKPSFDDFFSQSQITNGGDTVYSRLQAPFQPIYVAGYVMDKFSFDDIIFNVGVRVDRYDANQYVLADKYLFRPAYSAGDAAVQSLYGPNGRPANIGDDFVVYGNRLTNPTQITGYRDGDTWYNAQGVVVSDPTVIRGSEGIAPVLVNYDTDPTGSMVGSSLRKEAFRVYDPVVNVMPRIAFSFPISDQAVFFAHYDILTQRPTSNSRLNILEYAYLQNLNRVLNNPNLRPSRTIDYELGFQQVLSKSSSLKLAAYYRELRDQIQVRNVAQAWPVTYKSFDNIDFGTVKGFSATYDLRRTGNVWMRASYTLQFADGTGSDPETSLALINLNLPNLRVINPLNFDQRHRFQATVDFRYGDGTDYNGPMLFGKKILQRTGINFVADLGSGTPYSRSSFIVPEATGNNLNYRLDGSINGANLPWIFGTDMQIDRDLPMSFGGKGNGDKARRANLNVYLLVTNVFNTQQITGVYRATGSAEDDGFLAAGQSQSVINTSIDPQSFRELYAAKVQNPYNFGMPRTIRLGLRFDF